MALVQNYDSKTAAESALASNKVHIQRELARICDDESLWATAYPRESDGESMIVSNAVLRHIRAVLGELIHEM